MRFDAHRPAARRSLPLLLLSLIAGCQSQGRARGPEGDVVREVKLKARSGWEAREVFNDERVPVWSVEAVDFLSDRAALELVAVDDRGRPILLMPESGGWISRHGIEQGSWLRAQAHGDVDGRIAGTELYVGGASGHIDRLVAHPDGGMDSVRAATIGGREILTLACADLLPDRAGDELVAFTDPGAAYLIEPSGDGGDGFTARQLAEFDGRVRDSLVLAGNGQSADRLLTVSSTGRLQALSLARVGERVELEAATLFEAPMGLGRLARAPENLGPEVLYLTRDDGVVLRLEQRGAGFVDEPIYAGPAGPRGLAAGRFDADANLETVAVFGDSGRVELLTRRPGLAAARAVEGAPQKKKQPQGALGDWELSEVFRDKYPGNALLTVEVDGRNSTDELVSAGSSGRVVLISRPAGFGLAGYDTASAN